MHGTGWSLDAVNCLKLNGDKTEVMLLGAGADFWSPSSWPDSLGDCPKPVNKVKNLGVIFDKKLTFNAQINNLASTIWYMLKMITRVCPYIPQDSCKTLVMALVLARLDYANALYSGLQAQHLAMLQRLQNAAARLVLKIPRSETVGHRLRSLHWLSVGKRIRFKSLCLAYKALHGAGPQFLRTHLNWYVPARSLRSAHSKLLQVPKIKQMRGGGRSFLLRTAKDWNLLPITIKCSPSLLYFRKALKTWLFTC